MLKGVKEQLAQTNKEDNDTRRLKETVAKMEFTLQLRNTEILHLNTQIASLKQQNALKNAHLENEIISLKQETADIRYDAVKSKRLQNQKCEKALTALRKNFDTLIKQKDQSNRKICEQIKAQWKQQVKSLREKHERFITIDRNETNQERLEGLDKNSNYNGSRIQLLQQEKIVLLKDKKQALQQVQAYSQEVRALKLEFRHFTEQKNEQITAKDGEIQGLKFQQNLLRERIEELQQRQHGIDGDTYAKIQEFKQLNCKLTLQLEHYKLLVARKDEQILRNCSTNQHEPRQNIFTAVHHCNHLNLIQQMQRQIDLKDQEIDQLSKTIEEWSESIGFNKSASQRLQDISSKCQNTTTLNCNFVRALKQKQKEGPKKMIFR